ncbi:hypothetical protein KM043_005476 [Ampulex compressa]|nr:hypothetical protein KM043_005476 [Ampulex compressa]
MSIQDGKPILAKSRSRFELLPLVDLRFALNEALSADRPLDEATCALKGQRASTGNRESGESIIGDDNKWDSPFLACLERELGDVFAKDAQLRSILRNIHRVSGVRVARSAGIYRQGGTRVIPSSVATARDLLFIVTSPGVNLALEGPAGWRDRKVTAT